MKNILERCKFCNVHCSKKITLSPARQCFRSVPKDLGAESILKTLSSCVIMLSGPQSTRDFFDHFRNLPSLKSGMNGHAHSDR